MAPPNTCSNGTGFDLNDDGDALDDEIGEVEFNPNLKCEVLFFGSDRLDNSGDAHQAFWFFQNRITLGDTKSGGGFNFNGVHKNGDLLVISNFSNGGETSTIFVFVWDDTVDGNLRPLSDPRACPASAAPPEKATHSAESSTTQYRSRPRAV